MHHSIRIAFKTVIENIPYWNDRCSQSMRHSQLSIIDIVLNQYVYIYLIADCALANYMLCTLNKGTMKMFAKEQKERIESPLKQNDRHSQSKMKKENTDNNDGEKQDAGRIKAYKILNGK